MPRTRKKQRSTKDKEERKEAERKNRQVDRRFAAEFHGAISEYRETLGTKVIKEWLDETHPNLDIKIIWTTSSIVPQKKMWNWQKQYGRTPSIRESQRDGLIEHLITGSGMYIVVDKETLRIETVIKILMADEKSGHVTKEFVEEFQVAHEAVAMYSGATRTGVRTQIQKVPPNMEYDAHGEFIPGTRGKNNGMAKISIYGEGKMGMVGYTGGYTPKQFSATIITPDKGLEARKRYLAGLSKMGRTVLLHQRMFSQIHPACYKEFILEIEKADLTQTDLFRPYKDMEPLRTAGEPMPLALFITSGTFFNKFHWDRNDLYDATHAVIWNGRLTPDGKHVFVKHSDPGVTGKIPSGVFYIGPLSLAIDLGSGDITEIVFRSREHMHATGPSDERAEQLLSGEPLGPPDPYQIHRFSTGLVLTNAQVLASDRMKKNPEMVRHVNDLFTQEEWDSVSDATFPHPPPIPSTFRFPSPSTSEDETGTGADTDNDSSTSRRTDRPQIRRKAIRPKVYEKLFQLDGGEKDRATRWKAIIDKWKEIVKQLSDPSLNPTEAAVAWQYVLELEVKISAIRTQHHYKMKVNTPYEEIVD